MEIAGLGIGIAGLAGMFTTCLDVMERIDSYKDFGVDSRAIMSQLDAQKLLFKKWGTGVGFDGSRLKDDHHENLDDAATRSAVQNILNSIYEIAGGPDRLPPDKQQIPGFWSSRRELIDTQQSLLERFRGDASHKAKIGWTLRHKARFLALSQHFGNLITTLYNLVPPDAPKSVDPMVRRALRGTLMSPDGVSIEPPGDNTTSSWYIDTHRILIDIEKHIERKRPLQMNMLKLKSIGDMKKDLDAWLCASYTGNNYDNFIQKRLPGTSDWIIDREAFREWDSSDCEPSCAKVLWVNGPAGYGKTFLSARIVQYLKDQGQSSLAVVFSADLEDRLDPFIIGRHWVSQLISQIPDAFNLAYEKFDLHKTRVASSSEVMDLLKDIVHKAPRCTLVVDGLDEYFSRGPWSVTQSDGLESFIGNIVEAIRGTTSRIFLASREEQEIRNGLSKIDDSSVGVKLLEYSIIPSDVRPDATRLSESIVSQKLEKKSKPFRDEIARRMVDRCDSMLLQIRLLGSEIRATKNQKQTERIIDQTPLGLNNLYDRAWQRISERENKIPRALAILRWVAFGSRPLTILEMTEALILTDNEFVDYLEDEMPDELNEDYVRREILDFCASLVETRSSTSSSDWGSRTIHFTHFTVREYVLQHLQMDLIKPWHGKCSSTLIYESTQNNKLAEICLRYLIMSSSRTKTQHEGRSDSSRGFGVYAMDSLHKHVRNDVENYTAVSGLLIEFFCNEDAQWNDWRKHQDSRLDNFPMLSYKGEAPFACPLFYASLFGFQEVVEELIHCHGVDVDRVDESCRTGVLAAVHEGKHRLVEYFLQRNADVNKASHNGYTPLYVAATDGDYEMVLRFLESGADLTITSSVGETALGTACSQGHLEVAKLLLEKGADLSITSKSGWTALAAACVNGQLETVRLLLERGADLKVATNHIETPLALACSEGHLEVVELLLDRGGDMNVPNKSGWTALAAASANGHLKTTRLLLERGADLTFANSNGYTPLSLASSNGHPEIVKLLLKGGSDLTVANKDGCTPVFLASNNGHYKVVKILLDNGADINTASNNGWTPLSSASNQGHIKTVELLLERGADLNAAGLNGWNPLTCASDEGCLNVVKLLLEKGANLTIANKNGSTPIMRAANNGHLDVVRLLLDKGADINIANNDGWTPTNSASDEGHVEVVKLLLKRGASPTIANKNGSTPIVRAANNGHLDVVKLLLEKGADINSANNYGWTSTNIASDEGHVDVVELLLEKGADVNIANNNGWTPLYSASREGHVEVIRQLLKSGAEMSITNKLDRTPIFAAVCNGHLDAAELLLQEGATVATVDSDGDTPLHLAAHEGHSDIVQLLLRYGANIRTLDAFGRPPFFYTIKAGDIASFSILQCQESTQLQIQDPWGSNALSFAIRCGHEEIIRALTALEKESLHVEDRFGRTPIWWACKQGNMQMVERVAGPLGPVDLSKLPTGPPVRFGAAEKSYCDVCWTNFDGPYYACSDCHSQEFALCLECHSVGAHCLVDSHALTCKG